METAEKRKVLLGASALIILAFCVVFAMLTRAPGSGLLAYVESGDIWVKDLPDGKPVRLTNDGRNTRPLISLSGRWLAFQKGKDHIWITNTSGHSDSANLIHPEKVNLLKWAPESDRLAFIAGGELRLLTAGQKESTLLVPKPPEEGTGVMAEFFWSPDGKWIAYEYTEKRGVEKGEWPWRNSIRKVNVEKGESQEIIGYPPPDAEGSPGNVALAAWAGSRIYLWQCEVVSASIMADGCPLFFLDPEGRQKEVGVVSLLYPDFLAFSPDPGTLAIAEGADRLTCTNKRISEIGPDGGEEKILTESDLAAVSPAWAPDGSLLAYVAGPDISPGDMSERDVIAGMAKRRIWIIKPDGSEKRRLTPDDTFREECPAWLPDGRILFVRVDAQRQASVWLARKDQSSPIKVADSLSRDSSEYELPAYYGHINCREVFDYSPAGR
jgi:Tol biopolymer transport system component